MREAVLDIPFEKVEPLGISGVAKELGIHPMTVYRQVKEGKLPMYKVGGQWRIMRHQLNQWVEKCMNTNCVSLPAHI